MGNAEDDHNASPAAVRAKLSLLGGFKLSLPNGDILPLSGKRERALLAYLALSPNCSQPRWKLATLLWGDGGDPTLLDNLRTCVWGVRKTLDDTDHHLIASDGDFIVLNAGAFDVDAWTFEQLAGQTDKTTLDQAASLYGGDLLDGILISSGEFQTWVRDEAGRFRDLATDVLFRLAKQLADDGDVERAIAQGQRCLKLDPLHESAARVLMRLWAGTGRRAAAFQLFGLLSETLKVEIGAEPEAETRRLFDEISRGDHVSLPGIVLPENKSPLDTSAAARHGSTDATNGADALPAGVALPRSRRGRWPIVLGAGIASVVIFMVAMLGESYLPQNGTEANPEPNRLAFPLPEKPSIVILPFTNLSDDETQVDLADALTNDITTALSIVSEMFVIDGSSTFALRDNPRSAAQAAADLGVRYVLEGSVQSTPERVRVSARLADTQSGVQIWAELYDREISDTFALQDELSLAILTALQVQLTEGEQQRIMLVHGTQNLHAWLIAGQALRSLRHLTPEDNARARELYGEAVALDPNYPGALDGQAWSYILAVRFGWSSNPEADFTTAAGMAQRLVELDPLYSRTYTLLGVIRLMMNDQTQAVSFGERAITLDPNGSEVAALLALTLTYTDELGRSPDLMAKAMRLSPYYPAWYRWALGRAYRLLGRYDEAEAALNPELNDGQLNVPHLVELAATYVEQGKDEEAQATAQEILAIAPNFSVLAWTARPRHQSDSVNEHEREILLVAGLPN